jgi:hypothetical protein
MLEKWTFLIISYLSAYDVWLDSNHGSNGFEGLVSYIGEGALEKATTSKDGSRRANYPILTRRGGDKK